jgi:hypothetical protein
LEDRKADLRTPNYVLYMRIHTQCTKATALANASYYWSKIKQTVEYAAYFDVVGLSEESLDRRLLELLDSEEVERVQLPDGGFDYKRRGKNLRSQEATIRLAMQRRDMLKQQVVIQAGDETENMTLADLARIASRLRKEEEPENDRAGDGSTGPAE